MHRRNFIKAGGAFAVAPLASAAARWPTRAALPAAQAFDYAWLKGQARALATAAYQPPEAGPPALAGLDYDAYQAIRFRPDCALWADHGLMFRLCFFHLGRGFREAVRIHEVVQGLAREIPYDPAQFDFRRSGLDPRTLPERLGFAGLRVQFHTDWEADVLAFLGASYFRAVGADRQFGLSARGLALDAGLARGEEFPRFKAFWIERPARGADHLTLYALLDSPSVAGAYRFEIAPGATLIVDTDVALYPRRAIERLGIAPLSSMFQCGENDRRMANDWRPEIHDSDGLALWTGDGEWIWRPLRNPDGVRVNSYFDSEPRGFGLVQRDRNFDHYQDDGVFYERRPSVWIEPNRLAARRWGKGAVQLLEFSTVDETADNIAAWWNPADPPQPGMELLFSYRMHWGRRMPYAPPLAQVVATRTGIGGIVGQPRRHFSWRFIVDFAGGPLAALGRHTEAEAIVSASRGEIELVSARPLREIDGYRAMFDLRPQDADSAPIDLRLYLRVDGQPLSETWTYQWTPPPPAERQRLI